MKPYILIGLLAIIVIMNGCSNKELNNCMDTCLADSEGYTYENICRNSFGSYYECTVYNETLKSEITKGCINECKPK